MTNDTERSPANQEPKQAMHLEESSMADPMMIDTSSSPKRSPMSDITVTEVDGYPLEASPSNSTFNNSDDSYLWKSALSQIAIFECCNEEQFFSQISTPSTSDSATNDSGVDDSEDDSTEDDSTEDDSTEDGSTEDDSTEDGSLEDDSSEDDFLEDDFLEDDFLEDDSLEDDFLEDDFLEDDSSEDDSLEDDSLEDDSSEDDSTEDDSTEDDSPNKFECETEYFIPSIKNPTPETSSNFIPGMRCVQTWRFPNIDPTEIDSMFESIHPGPAVLIARFYFPLGSKRTPKGSNTVRRESVHREYILSKPPFAARLDLDANTDWDHPESIVLRVQRLPISDIEQTNKELKSRQPRTRSTKEAQ